MATPRTQQPPMTTRRVQAMNQQQQALQRAQQQNTLLPPAVAAVPVATEPVAPATNAALTISSVLNVSGGVPNVSVNENATQVALLLAPHMDGLIKAAEAGKLNEHQMQQLRQLARAYGPAIKQVQEQAQMRLRQAPEQGQRNAKQVSPSSDQTTAVPTSALPSRHSSSPSQAGSSPSVTSWHPSVFLKGATPSNQSPWPSNNPPQPVAGVKRKTPPISVSLGPQPPQPPQPQQPQQPQQSPQPQQPQSSNQSQPQQLQRLPSTFPHPMDPNANLESTDPGPVNWPNSIGSRPTLTAGLGGASILLSTPVHLVHPQMDTEALDTSASISLADQAAAVADAMNNGLKKDGKNGSASGVPGMGIGAKKTVKEIIASVDPTVKVDPNVEEFMLELADEFIDDVTHFACRLARHRGSDTLDVRDLQLHLESNLNLRIPGFSSDETRVSISHASTAGDILLAAGSKGSRVSTGAASTAGGTSKAGKVAKAAKGTEVKDRDADVRLGRGLRATRIAAVKAARKV